MSDRIPAVLRDEPLIRVKPESKEPVVDSYAVEPTEDVAEWVAEGGNAAICLAESPYVVVDVDTVEVAKALGQTLPKSFIVRTGSGWVHCYYHCPEWDRNVELGGGSIRSNGWIAVIPPSRHPDGGRYKVFEDREIMEVRAADLAELEGRFTDDRDGGHPEPSGGSAGGRLDDLDELIGHDGYREEVREVLRASDPAHDRRLWLVGFLSEAVGMSSREIVQLIERRNRWVDFDRGTTERQVESVVRGGGR